MSGKTSHLAGQAAERLAADAYLAQGYRLLESRWRGPGGEVDLIFDAGDLVVFVEVKKARTHDVAATRIGPRQIARIAGSAEAFALGRPGPPSIRLDAALVDAQGRVRIVENLTMG